MTDDHKRAVPTFQVDPTWPKTPALPLETILMNSRRGMPPVSMPGNSSACSSRNDDSGLSMVGDSLMSNRTPRPAQVLWQAGRGAGFRWCESGGYLRRRQGKIRRARLRLHGRRTRCGSGHGRSFHRNGRRRPGNDHRPDSIHAW